MKKTQFIQWYSLVLDVIQQSKSSYEINTIFCIKFFCKVYSISFRKFHAQKNKIFQMMLKTYNAFAYFKKQSKEQKFHLKYKNKHNNFSFAYLKSSLEENYKKSIVQIESSQKKSIQQPFPNNSLQRTESERRFFKRSLPAKTPPQKKTSFIEQRPLIYFNNMSKARGSKQGINNSKKKQSQKQNKESSFLIKKRHPFIQKNKSILQRNISTAKFIRDTNNSSTIDKTVNEVVCNSSPQINQKTTTIKEELYYRDALIREIGKIDFQGNEKYDQKSMSLMIKHFFKSVLTFFRYQNIKMPTEPHTTVFFPQLRRFKIKNTLIFDMDETLIHAETFNEKIHNQNNDWGQNFDIKTEDGASRRINLKIRPFVKEVLERLKKKFQIGLFTAANQNYARQIISKIDPEGKLFDFCLFRQHCHIVDGKPLIKDLRILSNRSVQNLILVDNSAHAYLYQLGNGIPIVNFYNDPQDDWMVRLQSFVINNNLDEKDDVRPILKQTFQFHKYCQFHDIGEMVETLYER